MPGQSSRSSVRQSQSGTGRSLPGSQSSSSSSASADVSNASLAQSLSERRAQSEGVAAQELAAPTADAGEQGVSSEVATSTTNDVASASGDLAGMTEDELKARMRALNQMLASVGPYDEQSASLQAAGEAVLAELRARALKAGRTHDTAAIERMKGVFVDNANGSINKMDCITTMNAGMRALFNDQGQAVGSAVHHTMGKLQDSGRAGAKNTIEFKDSKGRTTTGIREPKTLSESVWDKLMSMAGDDVGYSVFGMSLMDGYHSITLTLDNNNPSNPRVYWSDQWSSRGGWQAFEKYGLDAEITELTNSWWNRQDASSKSRTRVSLWRVVQKAE